jgi:hypothetical protein
MEEYLLTHGMLTQVEAWMLELLGNDLTPRDARVWRIS